MANETYDLGWNGSLTVDNVEEVVKLLKQLLDGKTFTIINCREDGEFKPDIDTGATLTENGSIAWNKSSGRCSISMDTTYGIWLIVNEGDDANKTRYAKPYVRFQWKKVVISHRSGSGQLIHFAAAVCS